MDSKEKDWYLYQNPYIMMLQLDKAHHRERIIIGQKLYMERYIRNAGDTPPILDITRPLGSFLFDIGEEDIEEWSEKIHLNTTQVSRTLFPNDQAKDAAHTFLTEKMTSDNPAAKFAAYQCAHFYQKYKDGSVASKTGRAENYNFEVEFLLLSFTNRLWTQSGHYSIQPILDRVARLQESHRNRADSLLTTWYPGKLEEGEWICISDSFYPALRNYLQRLSDWNIHIRRCQVCGKHFLAPNKRYSICGKVCKRKRSQQHKQAFDARAKKNGYDIDYKNATQRMRNRLKKLQESTVSAEGVAQAQAAYKSICKEACAQKKNIYSEYGHREFQNWLFEQEREFEQICERIKRQV